MAHFRWILGLALLLGVAEAQPALPQAERVTWKPVPFALLRVDDAAPKNWQVYRAEKRKNLLLVQMGARFLLLDLRTRAAYELAARTLTRTENTLEWVDPGEPPARSAAPATSAQNARAHQDAEDSAKPAKVLLPSAEWSMRDVGPSMRIRFRLTDEGRDFDVQFPIQPDLRQFY